MSPESKLPAVPRPGAGAPGEKGSEDAAGDAPSTPPPEGPNLVRAAGVTTALALGLVTALGVATLLGEGFREALLIEVDTDPAGAEPAYSDAPREAARFFADRDTVSVRVPRDMTLGDFLARYHLENNEAARAALRDQLGVSAPGDPLREGDRVTLPLTLRREER